MRPSFQVCTLGLLALLLALTAADVRAQDRPVGQIEVRVEIVPSVVSLHVRSTELAFGEVSEDASEVRLDPSTGERWGLAYGPHSTAEVHLVGPPGHEYAVSVLAPVYLESPAFPGRGPRFKLLWASAVSCTAGAFTQIAATPVVRGTLGADGCAALRFGGGLVIDGVSPGIYTGLMEVHFSPL